MKFLKYLILTLPASAILSGCINTTQTITSDIPDCLAGSFSSQIHIISGENEFKANVSKSDNGIWNAEFSEPASLSGAELTFEDGMVSASYKGLAFSIPKDALPVQSAMQNLILVSENLETLKCDTTDSEESDLPEIKCVAKDDMFSIAGSIDNGEFELLTDKNGVPLTFTMDNFELTIEFSDFVQNADNLDISDNSETEPASETSDTADTANDSTELSEN